MKSRKNKNNANSGIYVRVTSDSVAENSARLYEKYFKVTPAKSERFKTGSGRKYGVGGAACDIWLATLIGVHS